MIDTNYLPPELIPLWEAFRDVMFSDYGKKTPLLDITVTVKAVDLEKALKIACQFGRRDIQEIG